MICELLYLNKIGVHTQLVYEREINGPEIFFPSGICESQSETTEDLKFTILLKLILVGEKAKKNANTTRGEPGGVGVARKMKENLRCR